MNLIFIISHGHVLANFSVLFHFRCLRSSRIMFQCFVWIVLWSWWNTTKCLYSSQSYVQLRSSIDSEDRLARPHQRRSSHRSLHLLWVLPLQCCKSLLWWMMLSQNIRGYPEAPLRSISTMLPANPKIIGISSRISSDIHKVLPCTYVESKLSAIAILNNSSAALICFSESGSLLSFRCLSGLPHRYNNYKPI